MHNIDITKDGTFGEKKHFQGNFENLCMELNFMSNNQNKHQ